MKDERRTRFAVDTHIFRELGELLVSRESTALIELIKNSYDADATRAVVHAQDLTDAERGFIELTDNGTGMSPAAFREGFLTLASRTKEAGDRRSARYRRRFTGAKGVGRLAAHKLARLLEVQSIPWIEQGFERGVRARIDWDAIESARTLDEIEGTSALLLDEVQRTPTSHEGTSVRLSRLRARWDTARRARFMREVLTMEAPTILADALPREVLAKPLLFSEAALRDARRRDPGFQLLFTGDFAAGDEYIRPSADLAAWVVEVDAQRGEPVRIGVGPTKRKSDETPGVAIQKFTYPHPQPDIGPFFQARVLVREGASATAEGKRWKDISGIRVFLEGFRVLPYGERGNDWIGVDEAYAERRRSLPWLPESELEDVDRDAGLVFLRNASYFGAVFLTEPNAGGLKLLVNREGFVENESFSALVEIMRRGIALFTRVRAAAHLTERTARRTSRAKGSSDSPRQTSSAMRMLEDALTRASEDARKARELVVAGRSKAASDELESALREFRAVERLARDVVSELAIVRVLASIGTQMASFVHEVRGLLTAAEAIERAITHLREELPRSRPRAELSRILRDTSDLRRSVERQAAYLLDVVTPDARRRRSKQSLKDSFDAGARLVASSAERRAIVIDNSIPDDLQTPPMFRAEITTVFANLMTNAVKAAGTKGRIRAHGMRRSDNAVLITVENTGRKVTPARAERWFLPFVSTTSEVDPVLGQGMGLGLTITRELLDEYGASIHFVKPSADYAAAVQIRFPPSGR